MPVMRWSACSLVVALGLGACDSGPSDRERAAAELERLMRQQAAAKRELVAAEQVEEAQEKARNELRAKLTLLMADLGALNSQLDKAERALVAARTEDERAGARQQVEAIGFQRQRLEQRVRELELSTVTGSGGPPPLVDR
jgi:chromosome segregation ATPase